MNDARPQQALEYSKDIRILSNNTSVPRKYDWVEVYRDTTGNWNNMTMSKGNVTYDPAYERNNTICPENTVCRADRDPITGQLIFAHRSQIVTNEQAPGLYTAYFFPLPIVFYFQITTTPNYPAGVGQLVAKWYSDFNNGPACGRFGAHKTEILYPDGTVFYSKSYTADNPLSTTVTIPLPVLPVGQSFRTKYTVYPHDGNILQLYECVSYLGCPGYVFPGDRQASSYRDVRYIGCPFTEFEAGTYGQIKHECYGLGLLTNTIVMPNPPTVWPPPNLVSLKILPTTMTASSVGVWPPKNPNPPVPYYDYERANALFEAINAIMANWTVKANSTNPRSGAATFFDGQRVARTDRDTYIMNLSGEVTQGFYDVPGQIQSFYDCGTATTSGFTSSRGTFYGSAIGGGGIQPIGGASENYPVQSSPKSVSYTIADPFSRPAAFVWYGVGFHSKSGSVSFS